jgi:hypothetical protein
VSRNWISRLADIQICKWNISQYACFCRLEQLSSSSIPFRRHHVVKLEFWSLYAEQALEGSFSVSFSSKSAGAMNGIGMVTNFEFEDRPHWPTLGIKFPSKNEKGKMCPLSQARGSTNGPSQLRSAGLGRHLQASSKCCKDVGCVLDIVQARTVEIRHWAGLLCI